MLRRIVVAASALAGLPLLAAWLISERMLHPPARAEDHGLDDFGLPAEEVSFPSRDGTRLAGWFIPARSTPAPGVVLCHGWRRSRAELLPQAGFLHRAGYAVLMFDQRHRGESDGTAITMGLRERGDALGALDELCGRPEVDSERIALLGMSMGAVVSILVAAGDQRVRAVVAECPYASVDAIMMRALRHYTRVPIAPIGPLVKWVVKLRLGESLDTVQAIDAVGRIAPRPLLLIADERDAVVGWQETERLYRAAGEPKRFWFIPGADHACGWQAAPEEYERQVLGFLEEALVTRPAHAASRAER
jgi:fermentation-respiration switch protein FrsA (DUF1100 family)